MTLEEALEEIDRLRTIIRHHELTLARVMYNSQLQAHDMEKELAREELFGELYDD